jgi:Mn2+/Fe2+ NRAMP family transporter
VRLRPERDYAGLVVVLFAFMITVVVITDVVANVISDRVATEAEGRFVAGVVGAAIGVVSTYVGGNWHARSRARQVHQETKPEKLSEDDQEGEET